MELLFKLNLTLEEYIFNQFNETRCRPKHSHVSLYLKALNLL